MYPFTDLPMSRRAFYRAVFACMAGMLCLNKQGRGGTIERSVQADLTAGEKAAGALITTGRAAAESIERGSTHNQMKPRVVSVRAAGIITPGFQPARYLDHIDRERADRAVAEGICSISGARDLRQAWLAVLQDYQDGDRIAIKPNFNHLNHGLRYTITSPQLINAVIKQLVEIVGVPAKNIYVYDLCKKIPADIVRNSIFYSVQYVERNDQTTLVDKVKTRLFSGLASADRTAPITMRERIVDEQGAPVTCYLPKVLTQAEHLINMPLLTNHEFILNSGALKNHFGTVRFSNHNSYPAALHGDVLVRSITDINRNSHIQQKTRVVIADGIFGVFDRGEGPGKSPWKTFNSAFPERILISKDPVAVDSVMASMVARERTMRKLVDRSHDYLADAEENGLGTFEFAPNGRTFSRIEYLEVNV